MLAALKDLEQSDHIRMFDFLEKVYLLEDLSLGEIVLHVALFNSLDSHVLSCQLVDAKGDLAESTLADQFHEFIVLESGGRQLVVLLYVRLNELNQSIPLLEDRLVDLRRAIHLLILTSSTTASRCDRPGHGHIGVGAAAHV